jgi:methionyl-tRNA formyltransferase
MRILYLGNNWVGFQVLKWLKEQGEEVIGLILHPPELRKYGEEIINISGVDSSCIFDGSLIYQTDVIETIRSLKPEIGISALFGFILRKNFLNLMPAGCVNIHPALLPYNRGAYPNVWSIIEETPSGITIHYIDECIDTGDIIAQILVPVEPVDTGESLYRKLEKAAVDLFKETWPLIRSGKVQRIAQQDREKGTYHSIKDAERVDEIFLDCTYTAKELINIIRARTFPPYPGAYFWKEGRKVYLRLQLLYEEQIKAE